MKHGDHVDLLRPAGLASGGTWADLGAGSGAFTLALRELVGGEARIYAVDRERSALSELERAYRQRFGETGSLLVSQADFTSRLDLPLLDGAVMANSLHFHKDKAEVLKRVRSLLRPGGLLVLIEYNVDRGNPWVPFPLSFETFRELAAQAGYEEPRLLATHPSSFLREFYSAEAANPA